MSGLAGPGQPLGGRVMSTGTCIALIAIGAILRFAVTTKQTHGVNIHVIGVIVLLAGVLGLLLSMLVWSPLNPNRRRAAPPATSYTQAPDYGSTAPGPDVLQERPLYRDDPPAGRQHPAYSDDPPR